MRSWGKRGGLLPGLNYLVALEASARLGSFRAAAEEMHLTQGAVAQQIRALEGELGRPLFERQARGLAPTPAGQAYVERIRLALGIVEEATRELTAADAADARNHLTLSTTPSFASRWLIPRLPRLAEQHPQISLMIDVAHALRPLRGAGHVDLAIRWARPPFAAGLSHLLLHGRLVPVCAPGLLGTRGPAPSAWRGVPLISDSHSDWQRWFANFGNGVHWASQGPVFSQTSLAIDAAEQGLGIALVPRLLVEQALSSGALVLAADAACELETGAGFYLLTDQPATPDSAIARVIDWLVAEAERSAPR